MFTLIVNCLLIVMACTVHDGLATFIALWILFGFDFCVFCIVCSTKNPKNTQQEKRKIQREKEIEKEYGIIDFFEKDK